MLKLLGEDIGQRPLLMAGTMLVLVGLSTLKLR